MNVSGFGGARNARKKKHPEFAGIMISFIYNLMGYGVPRYVGLISHNHRFILLLKPNISLANLFS
jgi:hypothetical protein